MKNLVMPAVVVLLAAAGARAQKARDQLSAQGGAPTFNVPQAQAAPAGLDQEKQAILQTQSADGDALTSVRQTKEAVLFANEPKKKPRKWYLVFGAKTPEAIRSQLQKPLFEDPQDTSDMLGPWPYPFPKPPVHLTKAPAVQPPADAVGGGQKLFLMYYPAPVHPGDPPKADPRGLFAEGYGTGQGGKQVIHCLRPVLWWGEGVTDEQVADACKKNDLSFLCEGSGASAGNCKDEAEKKAREAKEDPLGGRL